jgi:hypothetical protein
LAGWLAGLVGWKIGWLAGVWFVVGNFRARINQSINSSPDVNRYGMQQCGRVW